MHTLNKNKAFEIPKIISFAEAWVILLKNRNDAEKYFTIVIIFKVYRKLIPQTKKLN